MAGGGGTCGAGVCAALDGRMLASGGVCCDLAPAPGVLAQAVPARHGASILAASFDVAAPDDDGFWR